MDTNDNNNNSNYIMPDTKNQDGDLNLKPISEDFFEDSKRQTIAEKSKLVFVSSIFFLIFGAFGLLQAFMSMATREIVLQTYRTFLTDDGMAKISQIMPIISIFALIVAIIQLVAGILGIMYSRRAEKNIIIIAFGVLIIAIVIINAFISSSMLQNIFKEYINMSTTLDDSSVKAITGSISTSATMIVTLISLVIPILYTVGGFVLKKRYDNSSNE